MFDATISIGNLITILTVVVGAVGAIMLNAYNIGRFTATISSQIGNLDARMERMESAEEKIGDAILTLAQQKAQLDALSQRIDDVQKYGSHRLAEVLEAMRGQIVSDFRERFEFLQRQIANRDH